MTMNKLLSFLIIFSLISCASGRLEEKLFPVYVTDSSRYTILPADKMKGNIDGVQRMCARFGSREFESDVYVIADNTQLSMTAVNDFGATMASLVYENGRLDFDSPVITQKIKAEYIVADFQFCLYDEEAVKTELMKSGVDFEVSTSCSLDGNCTESRILSKKNKEIARIIKEYVNEDGKEIIKKISYENFLRGYSYELTGGKS